jgi:hypothetical protein
VVVSIQHPSDWTSAIIKVNIETGEQFDEIFWHPGTIAGGTIYDINKDGEPEIICSAISNGMRGSALFILSPGTISGSAPSITRYRFDNIPINEFLFYVIFPATDISVYYKNKYNYPYRPTIDSRNEKINFVFREGGSSNLYQNGDVRLALNFGLNEFEPILTDRFVTVRDKLVDEGILPLPYTNTSAYIDNLKSSLLIWRNNRFEKFYNNKTN